MRNRSFLFFATIFCAFNLIVVNGGLILFGHDNTQLTSIRDVLLAKPTYSDSWDPMSRGLKIFLAGKDPTIYQQVFFDQKHKFQYPPTSLVIIDGLRKVFGSFDNANVVIDWISWVCLIGTIVFTALIFLEGLQQYVPEEIRGKTWLAVTLIALSALAYYPLHRAFVLGQIQVWLDFLFTLSVWFWLRNRNDGSGVCLGLISIIKPQMGLFLAWGFIRRLWKFCLSIAGVLAFFLTVSLWRYGLAAHIKYLEVLSYIGQRGETYFPNQSINGLINRMLHNGNNLHWDAWEFSPENATVRLVTISTSILLISFALFFSKQIPKTDSWLTFATAGLIFTLASPVAWEHHYGILLPIYALIFPKAWQIRDRWNGGLFWLAGSYLLTSNLYQFTNRTADTSWNFVQSYVFFGALILLGVLVKMQMMADKDQTVEVDQNAGQPII